MSSFGISKKERVVSTAVATALAMVPAWFFAMQLDPLLTPSDGEIANERSRHNQALRTQATGSLHLAPAGRPLMNGLQTDPTTYENVPRRHLVKDFPAVGGVDYESFGAVNSLSRVTMEDATNNGMNKVVRFRKYGTHDLIATLYLCTGRKEKVNVPPGQYEVSIAEGHLWYGKQLQFGPRGRYYAPQVLNLEEGQGVYITLPTTVEGDDEEVLAPGNAEEF